MIIFKSDLRPGIWKRARGIRCSIICKRIVCKIDYVISSHGKICDGVATRIPSTVTSECHARRKLLEDVKLCVLILPKCSSPNCTFCKKFTCQMKTSETVSFRKAVVVVKGIVNYCVFSQFRSISKKRQYNKKFLSCSVNSCVT